MGKQRDKTAGGMMTDNTVPQHVLHVITRKRWHSAPSKVLTKTGMNRSVSDSSGDIQAERNFRKDSRRLSTSFPILHVNTACKSFETAPGNCCCSPEVFTTCQGDAELKDISGACQDCTFPAGARFVRDLFEDSGSQHDISGGIDNGIVCGLQGNLVTNASKDESRCELSGCLGDGTSTGSGDNGTEAGEDWSGSDFSVSTHRDGSEMVIVGENYGILYSNTDVLNTPEIPQSGNDVLDKEGNQCEQSRHCCSSVVSCATEINEVNCKECPEITNELQCSENPVATECETVTDDVTVDFTDDVDADDAVFRQHFEHVSAHLYKFVEVKECKLDGDDDIDDDNDDDGDDDDGDDGTLQENLPDINLLPHNDNDDDDDDDRTLQENLPDINLLPDDDDSDDDDDDSGDDREFQGNLPDLILLPDDDNDSDDDDDDDDRKFQGNLPDLNTLLSGDSDSDSSEDSWLDSSGDEGGLVAKAEVCSDSEDELLPPMKKEIRDKKIQLDKDIEEDGNPTVQILKSPEINERQIAGIRHSTKEDLEKFISNLYHEEPTTGCLIHKGLQTRMEDGRGHYREEREYMKCRKFRDEVYLCQDLNTSQCFVLKEFQSLSFKKQSVLVPLSYEDKHFIVSIYGVILTKKDNENKDYVFVLQEYISGGPLTGCCKWDLEKIIKCTKRMLKALWHLHTYDIVHGDIKPDNVCLKVAEDPKSVCLIDFDHVKDAQFQMEFEGYTVHFLPPWWPELKQSAFNRHGRKVSESSYLQQVKSLALWKEMDLWAIAGTIIYLQHKIKPWHEEVMELRKKCSCYRKGPFQCGSCSDQLQNHILKDGATGIHKYINKPRDASLDSGIDASKISKWKEYLRDTLDYLTTRETSDNPDLVKAAIALDILKGKGCHITLYVCKKKLKVPFYVLTVKWKTSFEALKRILKEDGNFTTKIKNDKKFKNKGYILTDEQGQDPGNEFVISKDADFILNRQKSVAEKLKDRFW